MNLHTIISEWLPFQSVLCSLLVPLNCLKWQYLCTFYQYTIYKRTTISRNENNNQTRKLKSSFRWVKNINNLTTQLVSVIACNMVAIWCTLWLGSWMALDSLSHILTTKWLWQTYVLLLLQLNRAERETHPKATNQLSVSVFFSFSSSSSSDFASHKSQLTASQLTENCNGNDSN